MNVGMKNQQEHVMPRFISFICILACFSLQELSSSQKWAFDAKAHAHQFLLTYPRSGTNLMSCYIQSLTAQPIHWIEQPDARISDNRLGIPLDYTKTIIYRDHGQLNLSAWNKNQNQLLLVVRNYKESLHRANILFLKNPKDFLALFIQPSAALEDYTRNLMTYHNWDPAYRLLVYYEDLIQNPVEEMCRVLDFFGEEVPDFLTTEYLKEVSLQALESYHIQHLPSGGSHSKGEDLEYHTKQLPEEIVQTIDACMEQKYPLLWQQYLKRYASSKKSF